MSARRRTLIAFSECPDREGLLSLRAYTEHGEFGFTTSASVNHQVWFKQSCDEARASLNQFLAFFDRDLLRGAAVATDAVTVTVVFFKSRRNTSAIRRPVYQPFLEK